MSASSKLCTKCKIDKPLSEFYEHKSKRSGYHSNCKQCALEYRRSYRKSNPERVKAYWTSGAEAARASRLRRTFGITIAQYDELLDKQGGVCAICGKTPEENKRALAVDHDHKTGEIYGLLCTFDNHRFVGRQRNSERFFKAAKYLEKGTGWFVPKKKPKDRRRKKKTHKYTRGPYKKK